MFISDINLILTHYQPTASLQEGSLLCGRAACRAQSPAWTGSVLVLCSCTALASWAAIPTWQERPQTPHYLTSFVCVVDTHRWAGGRWRPAGEAARQGFGPRTRLGGRTPEEVWKGLFLPNVGSENAFPSLWERLGCVSRMPHLLSLKKTSPAPGDVITRPPFEISAYCLTASTSTVLGQDNQTFVPAARWSLFPAQKPCKGRQVRFPHAPQTGEAHMASRGQEWALAFPAHVAFSSRTFWIVTCPRFSPPQPISDLWWWWGGGEWPFPGCALEETVCLQKHSFIPNH